MHAGIEKKAFALKGGFNLMVRDVKRADIDNSTSLAKGGIASSTEKALSHLLLAIRLCLPVGICTQGGPFCDARRLYWLLSSLLGASHL